MTPLDAFGPVLVVALGVMGALYVVAVAIREVYREWRWRAMTAHRRAMRALRKN